MMTLRRLVPVLSVAVAVCVLLPGAAHSVETRASVGRHLLQTRGLWVQFEHRGSATGWYSGELLELIGSSSVRAEVVLQLRKMSAMGVNEIVYEVRSTDGPWPVRSEYPSCERSTDLGPLWPEPSQPQLQGLRVLFDLAQAQGMRMTLILDNTHMDEQPPTHNARWLSAILNAVKDKPALDYIAFGGDRHLVDAKPPYDGAPDSCGGESEAPLWLGPDSVESKYTQWAIGYARSLGLPANKLTAESIVGYYPTESLQGAGPAAQDGHLWRPLEVMRTIFDRLGFPAAERTYAVSYYPHRKCAGNEAWNPCTDADMYGWTKETLETSRARIGPDARMVVAEFGTQSSNWSHESTVEMFGSLLLAERVEGAVYWQWVNPSDNPQYAPPGTDLKKRGVGFVYNPQQRELADLYGFHLTDVPNGSFEDGPAGWSIAGQAQMVPIDVNAPWRGASFLRLTGKATSPRARISPSTRYTTTVHLRSASAVKVSFTYSTCKNKPTLKRKRDVFQPAAGQVGFQTFPLAYTTPADACWLRIEIASAASLDVDAVR